MSQFERLSFNDSYNEIYDKCLIGLGNICYHYSYTAVSEVLSRTKWIEMLPIRQIPTCTNPYKPLYVTINFNFLILPKKI